MAIAIEQRKSGSGLLSWMVIFTFIGGTFWFGYQIFLSPVDILEPFLAQEQEIISSLSQITIEPAVVINSQEFRNLRKQIPDVTVGQIGRTNPFLPF
ncbi:hypothetical protein A3A20_00410 [Candidatus Wolfebacteria bacterium RIFCSPLOWO2_01_FULL_45_19]|uniref:Uncharacterized protein n=1 Tax=Candidatus Wolfebacteria bacterium RIFCSPLOWO2_01_FULL_45_19 TaxID=1802557 RepID=A0A1F8DR24_9BACT|nr:MAG: hypothetical protein A3A20_00410 [Candidatus Wolfebacteria bacterium RIFCSPLOWO2_01_FULL_45_19]